MMADISLVRLERIARNLPIASDLEMIRVPTRFGDVFIAYGTDGVGTYHGVWGLRDIGRTISFSAGVPETKVKQMLLDDADWFGTLCAERGIYDMQGGHA